MNFLSLGAFWFAASIPVVILFYLLKRKRVVRLVSSTLLWQKFLAETQANAPFQKLRHNWLLVLQLLLLVLAILALARPYFAGTSKGGRLEVVILDASASMQSTDESPSRFDKARAEALKLVDTIRDNDSMVILQTAAGAEVKQSATSDKSALRRALQACAPVDTGTRVLEALKLAETLVKSHPDAEIHLFSDGAVGELADFENAGLPLSYHRIGQRAENLGITTLDVKQNPENPAQRAVFTSVANYSTNAHETQVEFRLDDKILEVKQLSLAPRETRPIVFIANQEKDGVFNVRLTAKDDLAVDNSASVISLLPVPVKVLLVPGGNRFLEKALRASPNVLLTVAPTLTDDANFDVVVLDNITPTTWPTRNTLAFHTVNPAWMESGAAVEGPSVVDWKSGHPLLRFVTFDNVQIAESILVKTPAWAQSVVESPQTPLVLAGEFGRQRLVWVGFDSLQSTWPLRVSFPIFVSNAAEWLDPAVVNAGQLTVQAGNPFRFLLGEKITEAKVRYPNNTTKPWSVNAARGELVFGDTMRQGIYHVAAGTNDIAFSVNLLDAAESDTTPRGEIKFGKYAKATATTQRRANLEYWRWLAAAGLAVMLFEWWYYHRRTV